MYQQQHYQNNNYNHQMLPGRPQNTQKGPRQVQIISNHFQLNLRELKNIYISAIQIAPRIEQDNRDIKDQIIDQLRSEIQQQMGIFLITGFTMYSSQQPPFQEKQKFQTMVDGFCYSLTVTIRKVVNIADIQSQDKKKSLPALNFFNILVKYFLKQLNHYESGRTCKFFDPTRKEEIPGTNLLINQGYETAVNFFEKGLFLRIDLSHRVIRTDTVLQQIKTIYYKYQDLSKEEKREMVRQELVGKIIVANYGNNRYWKIEDILFDRICSQFYINEDHNNQIQNSPKSEQSPSPNEQMTISDYYKSRYRMMIKEDRQPLIMSTQNKQKRICYLVPEFCTMTGIPDDFNDFQRKKVTGTCKKTAQQRMDNLENLSRRMVEETDCDKFMNPRRIAEVIGVQLSKNAHRFQAKQLEPPTLHFGKGEKQELRDANFMFKSPVYDQVVDEINIAIIHFKECNLNEIVKCFHKNSNMMQLNMREPKSFNLGDFNRKAFGEIEHILADRIKDRFQCVVIVLPFQMKNQYAKIKQLCLCQIGGIVSQIIMQGTLEKRNFQAICGKILAQIASKVGAALWVPKTPSVIPRKTILIGVDIENSKSDKQKKIVAVCASMNQTFSSFYTKVYEQQRGKEIIEGVRQILKDTVLAYFKKNKEVPEHIIFFRDGVQDNQLNSMVQIELQEMLKSFSWINASYKPKLCVIVVQKKPPQKFFRTDNQGQVSNPPFGTLIDSQLVQNSHDFFLVAQNVTQGTAKPTHYRVIYDDTGLDMNTLQELIFSQCFNYSNWTGAIRVPAPVMYSHKLAQMVAQSLGKMNDDSLNYVPYYL